MSRKRKAEVTAEEFAGWHEDPVTQWVLGELAKAADANKGKWIEISWDQGTTDDLLLTELKTRADAYCALAEISYADLVAGAEA
jgi:hypothetical protein